MRGLAALLLAMTIPLAGCSSPVNNPSPIGGDPVQWVDRLDQLPAAGFTVVDAPHPTDATALADADRALGDRVAAAGLQAVAGARYFRAVPDVSLSNGPLEVDITMARFGDATGASAAYTLLVGAHTRDSTRTAVSPGALGDAAHADTRTAQLRGTSLVQIDLVLRFNNVLGRVVIRGRDGATRIDDAVLLARVAIANAQPGAPTPTAPTPSLAPSGVLPVATPALSATARPAASPSRATH